MTTAAETRDNECGGGTSEEFTLSRPYVLDTVFQQRTAAAAVAGIRHGEGRNVGIGTKRKKNKKG